MSVNVERNWFPSGIGFSLPIEMRDAPVKTTAYPTKTPTPVKTTAYPTPQRTPHWWDW